MSIADNIPASAGSYSWKVDTKGSSGKHKIVITDSDNLGTTTKNNNYFSILGGLSSNSGVCGTANNTSTYSFPTSGLCASGVICLIKDFLYCNQVGLMRIILGTQNPKEFVWTCMGTNGGTDAKCFATRG